jgi:hypothetical protein
MPENQSVPLPKPEADMRNLAKGASLLALASVFVFFAALLAGLDALPLIEPFARAVSTWDWGLWGTTWMALLNRVAHIIPVSLYLLAVLGAAGILDQIGKGEYFSTRNIRALGDMGGAMLWGAVWAIFLVPSIIDWTGRAPGRGYSVDLSPETVLIAIIGLCLLVIGRLFLRARKLEAEMEEIV